MSSADPELSYLESFEESGKEAIEAGKSEHPALRVLLRESFGRPLGQTHKEGSENSVVELHDSIQSQGVLLLLERRQLRVAGLHRLLRHLSPDVERFGED